MELRRSSTDTLIKAMRILVDEIQSRDGIANGAIAEAADRLEELRDALQGVMTGDNQSVKRAAELLKN